MSSRGTQRNAAYVKPRQTAICCGLVQTGGTGVAAIAGGVAGHLVICVAEHNTVADRIYGRVIAVQNGAADRHAREAAVALIRLDAIQAIRGDDNVHDAGRTAILSD